MPTAQKVDRVAELKASIEGSAAMLLTEYRGLSVSEIAELRRSLRETETTLEVVKNTLMRLAVAEAGRDELRELLSGPSAVAFVGGDPVGASKQIAAAAKRYPALLVKGGWMDGRMLSAEEARSLADLDSREVMLAKVAGMLQSEIARAASMFQAAQSRFLSLLEAYKAKLPAEEATAESPTEAAAEVEAKSDAGAEIETADAAANEATDTADATETTETTETEGVE